MSAAISPEDWERKFAPVVHHCVSAHEAHSEVERLHSAGWSVPKIVAWLKAAYPGESSLGETTLRRHFRRECNCVR